MDDIQADEILTFARQDITYEKCPAQMSPTKYVLLVAKLFVTGLLLWLLFRKIELGPVTERLRELQSGWAVAVVAVTVFQLLLTGLRWHYVSRLLGLLVSIRECFRLVLIGQFFNQILPSSIGGDGVRAWLLTRSGFPLRRVLTSIISDRVAAMVVLGSIVAVTLPLLGHTSLPSIRTLALIIPIVAISSLLVLYFAGQWLSETIAAFRLSKPIGLLIRDVRIVVFSGESSLRILAIAVIVQALGIVIVHLCAKSLGINLTMQAWLLIPLILLVSMIPISFAGWGVRESAMVVGLGAAGVIAHDALAISVLYGLTQIAVGLPGSILMLTPKGRTSLHDISQSQHLGIDHTESGSGDKKL